MKTTTTAIAVLTTGLVLGIPAASSATALPTEELAPSSLAADVRLQSSSPDYPAPTSENLSSAAEDGISLGEGAGEIPADFLLTAWLEPEHSDYESGEIIDIWLVPTDGGSASHVGRVPAEYTEIQPIYTGSDDTVIRHTVDLTIPGELYPDGAEAGTLALTAMNQAGEVLAWTDAYQLAPSGTTAPEEPAEIVTPIPSTEPPETAEPAPAPPRVEPDAEPTESAPAVTPTPAASATAAGLPVPGTPSATSHVSAQEELAQTGVQQVAIAAGALLLLSAGIVAALVARRRHRSESQF